MRWEKRKSVKAPSPHLCSLTKVVIPTPLTDEITVMLDEWALWWASLSEEQRKRYDELSRKYAKSPYSHRGV